MHNEFLIRFCDLKILAKLLSAFQLDFLSSTNSVNKKPFEDVGDETGGEAGIILRQRKTVRGHTGRTESGLSLSTGGKRMGLSCWAGN